MRAYIGLLTGISTGLFLASAWARTGSLLQQAPSAAASLQNPLEGDSRAHSAGAKLYERECAACHGIHREGAGKAPPLSAPALSKTPAGSIFWVLRNGSLNRGMPSFAHLPEPQRWQIITYLRGEKGGQEGRPAGSLPALTCPLRLPHTPIK